MSKRTTAITEFVIAFTLVLGAVAVFKIAPTKRALTTRAAIALPLTDANGNLVRMK